MLRYMPVRVKRNIFFSGLALLFSLCSSGRVIPGENSRLNYTTVYFQDELYKDAAEYELFIYPDPAPQNDGGRLIKMTNTLPAFWVPDLSWGVSYSWRITAYAQNRDTLFAGKLHKFRIMKISYQGFSEVKVDIRTNNETKNAGGLIAIDYTRCIYNRNGKAVWTLPDLDSLAAGNTQVRDLKITKDNTITFLTNKRPFEIDLDGNVMWKGPYPYLFNNDTVFYHHDFEKTNRGTYMVLGERKVYRRLIGEYSDDILRRENGIRMIDNVVYKRTLTGLILEFNGQGKTVWVWDANDYLKDVDLNHKKNPDGIRMYSTHQNTFSENKEGTKIYTGFRNLSRVIRIDRKTKKVEMSYGEKYPSGEALYANHLFRYQNDVFATGRNSFYIFNNNCARGARGVSSIIELKHQVTPNDTALLWKFDLNFDSLSKGESCGGGNVVELPNSNLLVCSGDLNRVFELTKNKEVVWDAFILSGSGSDTIWQAFPQYRCSWVSRLNRYHFIIQPAAPLRKANAAALAVTVYNTGNAEDFYHIEVFTEKNVLLGKAKTGTVPENKKTEQVLNLKPVPPGVRKLVVKIRSGHSVSQDHLMIDLK